jgi:hypothetical protein
MSGLLAEPVLIQQFIVPCILGEQVSKPDREQQKYFIVFNTSGHVPTYKLKLGASTNTSASEPQLQTASQKQLAKN